MKTLALALMATVAAAPLLAQETREKDAHVHGVTTAEIAVEHGKIVINLLSPGMDIVGFEYAARTAQDKDAVDAAIRQFLSPEQIVTVPEAAGCRLTEVLAHLDAGDHAEDRDDDHANDDGHGHEEHGHEEHGHEDHADGEKARTEHSAFHVTYAYACDDEDAITSIGFPFFERFANAQEIEAKFVTETSVGTAELTRDAAELTLE